jgi:hypothetical protein
MSRNPVDYLPLGEIQDLCRRFGVHDLANGPRLRAADPGMYQALPT